MPGVALLEFAFSTDWRQHAGSVAVSDAALSRAFLQSSGNGLRAAMGISLVQASDRRRGAVAVSDKPAGSIE